MFRYTSSNQLSLDDFMNNLGKRLNSNNRWIILADQIPWDEFAKIYAQSLSDYMGRPSKDARLIIGAIIIKQMKGLVDEAVIPEIQENPYLQYFVGLKEFTNDPIFDPSLFVAIRYRLGSSEFDKLSKAFIEKTKQLHQTNSEDMKNNKEKVDKSDTDKPSSNNKGQLLIDAVVAPQDIKFPTDIDLLNKAREFTEHAIDILWEPGGGKRKPRTYRKNARKDYLNTAKKKRKSKKEIKKAIKKQLAFIRRNINTIKDLLSKRPDKRLPFSKSDLKRLWVVQEVFRQQKLMYDTKTNTVSDRIVSIFQPYVRPIVRGKAGKNVEFGAKLSCSLVDGNAYLDHLSWDAFNESGDLIDQVEKYHQHFGYYPESVHADKIYGSRENRAYLKTKNIMYIGKALGRPRKMSSEEKKAFEKVRGIRNHIEGKFGEGKRKYDLGLIMTKTQKTSESYIASIFFVMNLARWLRVDFFVSIFSELCGCLLSTIQFFKERFVWQYSMKLI